MEVSNRFLASFLIVFIIFIVFGTITVLEKLSGLATQQQAQVNVTVATVCGNNFTAGSSETCDGTDLKSQTCVTQGFDAGTLSCASNCLSFDTSQCTTVAAAAAAATAGERPNTNGVAPSPITYNPDFADTFDFAIGKVRAIFIKLNGENFAVNIEDFGHSAVLKITNDDMTKTQLIHFELGQTKPVDLDGDGTLDLTFTLTDILTRRAAFHMEKLKAVELKTSIPVKQKPSQIRTEILSFEDYSEYYLDAFLLLLMVILAILNFAIFKKFITSKK